MHEQPAFNQENQDSDWKKAVIVWNWQNRFSSTVIFHSILQGHIIQGSNLPKCNAGNANFGKVLKQSENLKKWIKNTKKIPKDHLLCLHALYR